MGPKPPCVLQTTFNKQTIEVATNMLIKTRESVDNRPQTPWTKLRIISDAKSALRPAWQERRNFQAFFEKLEMTAEEREDLCLRQIAEMTFDELKVQLGRDINGRASDFQKLRNRFLNYLKYSSRPPLSPRSRTTVATPASGTPRKISLKPFPTPPRSNSVSSGGWE